MTDAPEAYVIACLVLGSWERALEVMEEIGPAPSYAPHLAVTAARLLAAGRPDAALIVARRAVELDATCAPAQSALGRALAAAGEEAAAESPLLRAIELSPAELSARLALASLYADRNRPLDALPYVEQAVTVPPPTVSLCLIVRNESENLPRVIRGVQGLATEVIVVDTGSADDTVAVARRLGARVEHFTWIDDFAAARNRSLALATGEWILVMDADDEFPADSVSAVRRWLRYAPPVDVVGLYRRYSYPGAERDSVSVHPWLFRNGRGLRFEGAIHEVLTTGDGRPARPQVTLTVTLHHHGIDGPEAIARRQARNLPLLRRAVERRPDDLRMWFYLGISCLEMEAWTEAIDSLETTLRLASPAVDLVPKAVACLGWALLQTNRPHDAEARLRRGLETHPHYPDLWYCLGHVLESLGSLEEAVQAHEAALQGRFGPAMSWHDWSVREAKPHLALCDLRLAMEDPEAARRHLEAAERFTGPRPHYPPIRAAIDRADHEQRARCAERQREIARCGAAFASGDAMAGIDLVERLLESGDLERARGIVASWRERCECDAPPPSQEHCAGSRIAEGLLALASGTPAEALDCFSGVPSAGLAYRAYLGEAAAWRALDRPAQAERVLLQARALGAADGRADEALAELYLTGQRWAEAATCYQRFLEQHRDAWSAWLGLGKAMLRLGHLPTATDCYQLAASLSGGHAVVRVALAEARAHLMPAHTG